MTDPSVLRAAKAELVEKTFSTSEEISSATSELSPPYDGSPQVTTLPSSFKAAKAVSALVI